jgi:hypothetical protein
MPLIVADRVQETTNTTGTGAYTLGGAIAGFQTFAAAVSNTDTVYYSVTDDVNFEVGLGTYASSGGTITRTTVFASSNSDAAVNWSVGTKNIFLTYPADKAVIEDASNNVTIGNNLVVGGTVDGRDVAADGTKLDGVEASADVTDTANVTSAGAAMKANNLSDLPDKSTSRTNLGVAIGSNVQAYSSVLQNTTASFLTADETKLDYISVTQAVDLDQMETDIAALANGMVYKGDWDASSGSFPGGGSAQTGWFYYVSVAGTVNSIAFAVGDNIIATVDNASTSTYANNWSKHDQTDAVQAVVGLTGSIAKSSLLSALNVEDGADVTDTANVTSAGALMDSEVTNLAQVKAFDSADYATAAQGTLAASAVQPNDSPTFAGLTVDTDTLFVDATNNRLGVGKTNPATPLDVTGTVTATAFAGDGSSLTGIAAGATGGGSDQVFYENGQNVTTNYTITNAKNAMSAGPITIDNGVTVTVGDGETWTVV